MISERVTYSLMSERFAGLLIVDFRRGVAGYSVGYAIARS